MSASNSTKVSTELVKASREKRRSGGGGRVDAQLSAAAMIAIAQLTERTGLNKSDLVDVALQFLLESMNNGQIMRSELDVLA